MTEHGLDTSDISTVLEEVGSEAVAESMRVDVFYDSGLGGIVFDEALDAPRGQPECFSTALLRELGKRDEESRIDIVAMFEISLERVSGFRGKEDDAELGAFASDAELFFLEIYMVTIEGCELRYAESGREKKLENGMVTK